MRDLYRWWWGVLGPSYAINAYCGVMGSGKSYEVVSGPLLDAVAAGRRVVTNIDGVNEELIHEYLCETRKLVAESLGRIVHVKTEDLLEPGFFPVEVEAAGGATVVPGVVLPGDLLVVDEAWKLWQQGEKLSKETMAFFRMHRHFVDQKSGLACDVVLMIQSIGDLNRSLKAVVELSFVMVKLKTLGMPTKYRVEMYEGYRQTSKTRIGTFLKRYKAEIFPLYKSYAGGAGKEKVVDSRQNMLGNKVLWGTALLTVALLAVGGWMGWRFFHPEGVEAAKAVAGGVAKVAPASGAVAAAQASPAVPKYSSDWRVAGGFEAQGVRWVVLTNAAGVVRLDSPSEFQNVGLAAAGVVDGQHVTTWSGGRIAGGGPVLGGAMK